MNHMRFISHPQIESLVESFAAITHDAEVDEAESLEAGSERKALSSDLYCNKLVLPPAPRKTLPNMDSSFPGSALR